MNLITFNIENYQNKIKNHKQIIQTMNNLFLLKQYHIFTRIDISDIVNNKKCNFCTKSAIYSDIEFKNYCWLHRCQYE